MTRKSTLSLLTAAASSALLAACAVGPKAPPADLPTAGTGAFVGSASPTVSTAQARDDWWRLYDDPQLDALLAAHKQLGGGSALPMPAGFLRNATFEGSGR